MIMRGFHHLQSASEKYDVLLRRTSSRRPLNPVYKAQIFKTNLLSYYFYDSITLSLDILCYIFSKQKDSKVQGHLSKTDNVSLELG